MTVATEGCCFRSVGAKAGVGAAAVKGGAEGVHGCGREYRSAARKGAPSIARERGVQARSTAVHDDEHHAGDDEQLTKAFTKTPVVHDAVAAEQRQALETRLPADGGNE